MTPLVQDAPIDTSRRKRNKKSPAETAGFAADLLEQEEGTSARETPETPATSPASQESEEDAEHPENPGGRAPGDHLPVRAEDRLNHMAGTYGDTWRHAAAASAEGSWIRARVFLREMRKVAGVNYSVASSRANAIKVLDDILSDDDIVSRTKRFPAEGAYVCLEEGEVCRLMGIIRAALAFRETEEARDERARVTGAAGGPQRRDGPPHAQDAAAAATGPPGRPVRNEYNDSHMSFMHGCSELVTGVTKGDLTYTQKKFEEKLALTWT